MNRRLSSFKMSRLSKFGVIVMLLVLLIGPMLQIYDCFNDAPNVDHDALLHTIDALLSIGLILALSFALLWVLTLFGLFADLAERLHRSPRRSFCELPIPNLRPQPLALRV